MNTPDASDAETETPMNPFEPPVPPPDTSTATHADVAAWVDRCADRRARIARQLKIADAAVLLDFTKAWFTATRIRAEEEGTAITNPPDERRSSSEA